MYYTYDAIGYGLIIISLILTVTAEIFVKAKYSKYRKVENKSGLTGVEVARKILDANGLKDIYVTETKGVLTDHYDPNRKVVRLSPEIFDGTTIASASIAAHEVGHAIQHKEGYFLIKLRGLIFPIVGFASKFGYIAIVIGFLTGIMNIVWAGIGLEIVILLFQLITLPVEFDASKRAIVLLEKEQILEKKEISGTKQMLKAAAWTYIAGVAATILEILRLVLIITGRDD